MMKTLRLISLLALGAVSARAAAPIRLVVSELSSISAARPLVMPAAATGFSPAPVLPAASLAPTPTQALPLEISPAFDGAVPAADGDSVYPRLAVSEDRTFRLTLQLNAVRNAVARALGALRESVALGGWSGPRTTLDESCCGDAAPKLALLLRAQGVPARLVEAEFHYYVILDLPDGQIIVDPTVRQFFGKKLAPRAVPHVFVGSIADLHSFFQRHAGSKTTRYDPRRIYFSESIVREDMLRAFEAKARAGGAAEHDPLRRFLRLPPAAARPPDSPGLIIP